MHEALDTEKQAIDGGEDEFGEVGGFTLTAFPGQRPLTYDSHIFIIDNICLPALLVVGVGMIVEGISDWPEERRFDVMRDKDMSLQFFDELFIKPGLFRHQYNNSDYIFIMLGERFIQGESSSEAKALIRYKRRLLIEVILFVVFCLLVLLERIFYQIAVRSQGDALAAFQIDTHLSSHSNGAIAPADILNSFYTFWASLSDFNIQFLILTNFLITIYFLNSALASKIAIVSLAFIQCLTFLQLIYAGERPHWANSNVCSSRCNESLNHPDMGSALLFFVPFYTLYCWRESDKGIRHSYRENCKPFGMIALVSSIVLTLFLNYVTGSVFCINIALSLLICLLSITFLSFINSKIDKTLNLLTKKQQQSSHQIKLIFFVISAFLFIEMIYSNSPEFSKMQWIKNHLKCRHYTNDQPQLVSFDKIIGPWFNFKQAATSFALMALVIGIPYCYSHMKSRSWSRGTFKQRAKNIFIFNLAVVPSWVFELLLKDEGWIKEIGSNSLIIDAIHYFFLYLFLFGILPPIIARLFKTVEPLEYNLGEREENVSKDESNLSGIQKRYQN